MEHLPKVKKGRLNAQSTQKIFKGEQADSPFTILGAFRVIRRNPSSQRHRPPRRLGKKVAARRESGGLGGLTIELPRSSAVTPASLNTQENALCQPFASANSRTRLVFRKQTGSACVGPNLSVL